jgi:hypothetical protein
MLLAGCLFNRLADLLWAAGGVTSIPAQACWLAFAVLVMLQSVLCGDLAQSSASVDRRSPARRSGPPDRLTSGA